MTTGTAPDAAPDAVHARASRAFGWSFGNTVAARLGTLAIGVALARVLGPQEFGVFAIATVTLLAVLSFNELGVSLAVIRWREHPSTTAPTINTIATLSSLVLTVAMLLGAPTIATLLGDVRATPVVRVLAVSVLLNGLVATPAAILQREFMQKQRTIADQVNTWLGAGLSLVLALGGWGAMSLAIGRLIASLVFGVLLLRWCPVPYRFGWDRAIARRLLRFGLPLAASSIVVFAAGYADQMVVGATLGAQTLGFYVLAFNLASWPVTIFSQPLRAVAPAMFAALRSTPARMTGTFARLLVVLACVAVPACLAISGAAGPVVALVYGAAWSPSAQVLVWMAGAAALKIVFELAYDYLVVEGRSSLVLLVQVCAFAVSLPLMLLVARPWGAAGVAAVQVGVALVVTAPLYLLGLRRAGIGARAVLKALAVPSAVGVLAWFACRALSSVVALPVLAAPACGLLALLMIAGLGWWQRDNVRRFRAARAGGGGDADPGLPA